VVSSCVYLDIPRRHDACMALLPRTTVPMRRWHQIQLCAGLQAELSPSVPFLYDPEQTNQKAGRLLLGNNSDHC
jgi:hypothetical protein